MKQRLKQLISQFTQAQIVVVGDVAIDEMISGEPSRLSREAPVLILKHKKTDCLLGAAGNAAHNIASLGAEKVYFAGVCGKDYQATQLLEALSRDRIESDALIHDDERPTTTKTRISGQARQSVQQQIIRIDRESDAPISPVIEDKIIAKLEALAPQCQAILLSDYDLGVITPKIIETCRALSQKHNIFWTVDSHRPLTLFAGATIATPNQPEAEQNIGHVFKDQLDVINSGKSLLTTTQLQNLLITQGGDGMTLFDGQSGEQYHIPVFNRSEVFDVTGAGDTVIATLTLALCAGANLVEASILGNLAASIVVRHFGTATTTQAELVEALDQLDETIDWASLEALAAGATTKA